MDETFAIVDGEKRPFVLIHITNSEGYHIETEYPLYQIRMPSQGYQNEKWAAMLPADQPTPPVSEAFLKTLEDGDNCTICQESCMLALPCLHKFHTACILKYLRKKGSCPVCVRVFVGSEIR
uniref:E3 ubiquitin-protein ligase SDIR1-like n=1 Tax=Erigeron canadensis TaxID=72917 RepID=UPI001CB8A48E|nr:E3 ubiquitin-protein ligase SDIR1-like [Erigeron canadensis]